MIGRLLRRSRLRSDKLSMKPWGKALEAAIAGADEQGSHIRCHRWRAPNCSPQLNFTEDVSRGNDPVYAFGRGCGEAIHAGRFCIERTESSLNRLATLQRASPALGWHSIRSRHRGRSTAPIFSRVGASLSAKAADQQIAFRVVGGVPVNFLRTTGD